MPDFMVCISRERVEYTYVTVTAPSTDDARLQALAQAQRAPEALEWAEGYDNYEAESLEVLQRIGEAMNKRAEDPGEP